MVRSSGFVGRLHLTVPLATLVLGLADRPGEIPGLGPVDPWLARDLARAAAANPKTTWCLTVTDQEGHAIGHGCARVAPRNQRNGPPAEETPGRPADPARPAGAYGPAGQHHPAGQHRPDGPGFTVTVRQAGTGRRAGTDPGSSPPASPGQRDLAFAVDPIATGTCDHPFEAAAGHDPGRKLPST